LEAVGVDGKSIRRWTRAGYLHRVLPRVYAVGHDAPSVEADLAAALLYAGPGAMLSHATAAWWWGLIDQQPKRISVSTPRRCRSLPGIRVYGRRQLERGWHKRLPVTLVSQTLLDYATTCPRRRLRRALAEADYRRRLNPVELQAVLARGKPGSAKLRQALEVHQPRLAHTRSPLEELFVELCERHQLPLPNVNVTIEGFLVDALWPEHRLVVELDGTQAHATPARLETDRTRELTLRRAGYTVNRYSWRQVTAQPQLVAADVRAALNGG
jgi:very-short-patch-repair endonuclease